LVHGLLHFASRGALDIDGLGEKIATQLVEQELVDDLAGVYDLDVEDLAQLERMAEKSARNLIDALEASKRRPLGRVIFALGIREVGEATANALAQHFRNLEALMEADAEALQKVRDVGPIVAQEIVEYFARDENLALVERLRARGLAPEAPPEIEIDAQPLAGETWVLTGTLEALDRKAAKVRLEALGAKVSGSVSAKTTQVVAGPGAGKKRADAERHGVPIFDEAEFIARLAELER
jgi:DNA ligase (NAD+)